jgi:hypothetical protein
MSIHNLYAGLIGSKVVVVTITREDIEACNTAPALRSLNCLVDSMEALEASDGTISLLVSGYDDDPRELHLIPEVRAYFQRLDENFPFWFHVCTRIEHTLRLLFMLLADLTPAARADDPSSTSYYFANDDLHLFISQRMDAMDSLHAKYGFSEEKSQRIGELVLNYFESLIVN